MNPLGSLSKYKRHYLQQRSCANLSQAVLNGPKILNMVMKRFNAFLYIGSNSAKAIAQGKVLRIGNGFNNIVQGAAIASHGKN